MYVPFNVLLSNDQKFSIKLYVIANVFNNMIDNLIVVSIAHFKITTVIDRIDRRAGFNV
jgi:hypothetical protein